MKTLREYIDLIKEAQEPELPDDETPELDQPETPEVEPAPVAKPTATPEPIKPDPIQNQNINWLKANGKSIPNDLYSVNLADEEGYYDDAKVAAISI